MRWPVRISTRAPAAGTLPPSQVAPADHGPLPAERITGSSEPAGCSFGESARRRISGESESPSSNATAIEHFWERRMIAYAPATGMGDGLGNSRRRERMGGSCIVMKCRAKCQQRVNFPESAERANPSKLPSYPDLLCNGQKALPENELARARVPSVAADCLANSEHEGKSLPGLWIRRLRRCKTKPWILTMCVNQS